MSNVATDTSGKYVTSVDVADGTITITYGNEANAKIATDTLALTPYETPDASVAWQLRRGERPGRRGAARHEQRWQRLRPRRARTVGRAEVPAEGLPSVIRITDRKPEDWRSPSPEGLLLLGGCGV